jgi:acyl carrier protein
MTNAGSEVLFSTVKKILSKKLKFKESSVTPEANLRDDLGVDSVDIFDIITKMEEEFKITIQESDMLGVNTVQDIVDILKERVKTV